MMMMTRCVRSGGRFAGYGFYLLKGKPVFLWNLLDLERIKWEGPEALTPGKYVVEFDFKYEGLGVDTLKVDGKAVAEKKMEKTLPIILQWDESFDIGSDTDYKPPFNFTGTLDTLTIKVERPQLTSEDIKKLETAEAKIQAALTD